MAIKWEVFVTDSTFGIRLARARAEKGIGLEKVADDLKILKRYLVAIEAEKFDEMPEHAYARGFVINYAKYLGLDSQSVASDFEASYPSKLRVRAQEVYSPIQPSGTINRGGDKIRINGWLVGGAIGLLLLAFLLFKIMSSAKGINSEPPPVQSFTPSEQSAGASLVGVAPSIPTASNTVSSTPTANMPSAIATTATGELDFWVKGKSTIEVKDATGQVLLSGKKTRGAYKVQGLAPFSVMVDNPKDVSLNFNKDKFDIKSHIDTDGRAVFSTPATNVASVP